MKTVQKYFPMPMQNMVRRIKRLRVTPLYKRLPLALPTVVHIDPSNVCNFKCVFCPTADSALLASVKRFKGMMPLELFRKIIDDCAIMAGKCGTIFEQVHLYKDGEPLTHPHFVEMAAYAKQKKIARNVATTTNGSLLTNELSSALIQSGIDTIRVSVEHCNEEGYAKITKTFSDFQRLLSNIAFLYREKQRQLKQMHIIIKINDMQLSSTEKKRFIQAFRPICDEIKIDSLMGWSSSEKKDFTLGIPVTTAMDGITPLRENNVCPEPFSKLAINPDGSVSVCCVDWAYQTLVGDLKKQTLEEIWHGEALREFRLRHLYGQRSALPACASCQYLKGFPSNVALDAHVERLTGLFAATAAPRKEHLE
jgi:radical SAM protein with 4Fe4S-binding SPASM domain